MRRMILAMTGAAVLLAAVLLVNGPAEPPAVSAPSHLETASIQTLTRPAPLAKAPKPKFTRTIYASVKLAGASPLLDACQGPIAVKLGRDRPVLVAEHNYCGGLAWMPALDTGDAVRLKGDGVEDGIYVVTEIRFQLRRKAMVKDLPRTDAVLQTCVSTDKMILVGVNKFDPYEPA